MRKGAAMDNKDGVDGADSSNFLTVAASETAGQSFVLIETTTHWFLAPKLDPNLQPGTMVIYNERLWKVTWASDHGFGEMTTN